MKLRYLIVLIFLAACASTQEMTKPREDYINIFNTDLTGIQENKLQQASESYYRGNYTRSYEFYQDVYPSFLASDNQEAIINILILMSNCMLHLEKYDKALELLQVSGKRVRLILDPSAQKEEYRVLQMIEVGNLLLKSPLSPSPEYTRGILQHTLMEANETGSSYLIMKANQNMGDFLLSQKKFQMAEEYLQTAFIIANKQQKTHTFVNISRSLARLHIEQKDYLEAFDKLVFAYRVYQKENYNFLQAFILMDMAEIYDRLSNYKIALRYYQRAYEMILTNENTEEKIKNRHIPLLEQKINQLKSHLPDYKQQNLFQAPTLN